MDSPYPDAASRKTAWSPSEPNMPVSNALVLTAAYRRIRRFQKGLGRRGATHEGKQLALP